MEDAVGAAADCHGFFGSIWRLTGDADIGDGHRVSDAFDPAGDSEVVGGWTEEGGVKVGCCEDEVVWVFGV